MGFFESWLKVESIRGLLPRMEEGSERRFLPAPGARRLQRLSRRFFALRLDMMGEKLSSPKEEEEPSEMFKTGGSLEYEEEEVLERAASRDVFLVPGLHCELEVGCSAKGDGLEECREAEDWALNVLLKFEGLGVLTAETFLRDKR